MANGMVAVPNPRRQPVVTSKLPTAMRFPLLVLLSLSLSALLYSVSSELMVGDLSSVSRSLNEWWQVGGLLGCKTLELAVGWWGEFDGYDLASLTLLSHMPPLYLLTAFYGIRPTTALSSLAIDMAATYIPFRLLRPVLATHASDAPKGTVSNRSIINDLPVQLYTTVLAAGVYAVVVFTSFLSWLPVHLVTHFDGIRDISAAHNSQLPTLILFLLPVGIAAKSFLFTPATGAKPDLGDMVQMAFNPETASLGETIRYNVWGYSKRTRTMIKRSATLAALCFVNTTLQVAATIAGAEAVGAAGWAGVWSTAALLTGATFWWVGHVDGVSN